MLRFLLIRPGSTEFDQQGRVQGTLDIPLSEDGRRETVGIVEQLRTQPIAAVYAAPSQSAKQTADSLSAALGIKSKTLEQLRNLDHGLWQGMLIADVKAKQPKVYRQWQEQPETVCPPQGETIGAARQRVRATIVKLIKKHKSEGLLAVVVPEPLASIFRQALLDDELGDLWQCSTGSSKWELIEAAETAAAK
jgi:probable phosphoglycerate mutase